jgi:hypothetical protein
MSALLTVACGPSSHWSSRRKPLLGRSHMVRYHGNGVVDADDLVHWV